MRQHASTTQPPRNVTYHDLQAAVRRHKAGDAKLTLVILADYAGYDDATGQWSCYPGQDRLAAETEHSARTVRRHLADLMAAGVIHIQPRYADGKRASNVYVFDLGALALEDTMSSSGDATRGHPASQVEDMAMSSEGLEELPVDLNTCVPSGDDTSDDDPGPALVDGLPFPTPAAAAAGDYPADFVAFWNAYPRRIEKGKAYRRWIARLRECRRDGVPIENRTAAMIVAAEQYAVGCRDRGTELQFTKHPASFLGTADKDDQPWRAFVTTTTPDTDALPRLTHDEERQRNLEQLWS